MSTGRSTIHARRARARGARSLGAPDGDRARARASARSGARRLGDEPRDDARQAARPEAARARARSSIAAIDLAAAGVARPTSRGRASSTSGIAAARVAQRARCASSTRTVSTVAATAGEGTPRRRGVRLARIPPDRCTSATAARPRSATRSRSLLEWTGWAVSREYYYNDAGVQIENLAPERAGARPRASAVGRVPPFPRAAITASTSREIAAALPSRVHPNDADAATTSTSCARFAVRELRDEQDLRPAAFGVRFDMYYLESSLYTDGRVERPSRRSSATGTLTRRTARSGSAPPSSATTRTA